MSNCHISQTVTCKQSNLKEKWEFHTRSPGQSAITILFLFKMLYIRSDQIRSVAQSCPTLCNPTNRSTPGLPVCPSPTPGVYSNSCPLSWWCHPTISSSVIPFSDESVLCIRWPKYWSFKFSISPFNEYSRLLPLGWTGWISLQSKGLSGVFSNTTVQKHQSFGFQLSL